MKNIFFLILLSCIALTTNTYADKAGKPDNSIDRIVAIVNDDVVTRSELHHSLALTKMQMTAAHTTIPSQEIMRQQALDQLINKKLQLQIAKQIGIKITDDDLNNVIKRIADQNQVSIQTLYNQLSQEGMSVADYRDEMRDQITLQKLQQQEVINHVSVTPEEITLFMHSEMWHNPEASEYRIEDILIPITDAPKTDELSAAKQRAEAVMVEAQQGNKIHEASAQVTDLGWRKLSEIPSAFAEQVAVMQAKEVAGPIQTANGFHILRLTDVRNSSAAPDRKQAENALLQRKFEDAIKNWVSKLRAQAFIQVSSKTAQA